MRSTHLILKICLPATPSPDPCFSGVCHSLFCACCFVLIHRNSSNTEHWTVQTLNWKQRISDTHRAAEKIHQQDESVQFLLYEILHQCRSHTPSPQSPRLPGFDCASRGIPKGVPCSPMEPQSRFLQLWWPSSLVRYSKKINKMKNSHRGGGACVDDSADILQPSFNSFSTAAYLPSW